MDRIPFDTDPFVRMRYIRSTLIDSFALAERSLCALVEALGLPFKNELVGIRIERVRKAKAGPNYSKERRTRVHAALEKFQNLLIVRNFLVHAHMQELRMDDGSCYAGFKILRAVEPSESDLMTFSEVQLHAVNELALSIASELRIG